MKDITVSVVWIVVLCFVLDGQPSIYQLMQAKVIKELSK